MRITIPTSTGSQGSTLQVPTNGFKNSKSGNNQQPTLVFSQFLHSTCLDQSLGHAPRAPNDRRSNLRSKLPDQPLPRDRIASMPIDHPFFGPMSPPSASRSKNDGLGRMLLLHQPDGENGAEATEAARNEATFMLFPSRIPMRPSTDHVQPREMHMCMDATERTGI